MFHMMCEVREHDGHDMGEVREIRGIRGGDELEVISRVVSLDSVWK